MVLYLPAIWYRLCNFVEIQLIYPQCRLFASVNRVSIGSDNGLSPIRRQAINLTNAGLLLITPLGASISEILIKIQHFHS